MEFSPGVCFVGLFLQEISLPLCNQSTKSAPWGHEVSYFLDLPSRSSKSHHQDDEIYKTSLGSGGSQPKTFIYATGILGWR